MLPRTNSASHRSHFPRGAPPRQQLMLRPSCRRCLTTASRKSKHQWWILQPIVVIPSRRSISGINPLPVDSDTDSNDRSSTWGKVSDAVWTTTATLVCLGLAGYGYHKYYKWVTLKKIEKAFQPGDPALDLLPRVIEQAGKETHQGNDNSHFVTR